MIKSSRPYPLTHTIFVGAIALSHLTFMPPSHAEPLAQADTLLLDPNPTAAPQTDPTEEQAQIKEQGQTEAEKSTVATYIKQGNDAYVEAEYESAIAAYTQALQLYNQNAYAYYNRGNAYRKLNNNEAALRDYTLAIRLNPGNYHAYYYRGMVLAANKNYDQAIADFSAALDINNQIPFIYVERAETYEKLKNKDAAKDDYLEAIKLYKKEGKDLKAELLQRKVGKVRR